MVHFSYKGGCGVCECMHIKAFKRRAGLGYIDKWHRVISNSVIYSETILYVLLCGP